ncbi:MAG TPA: hypothetical protein PLA24_08820 [Tenuifilaceae bacterium]|nr:hypothetical protein [Tenuifilaceae bacterium]
MDKEQQNKQQTPDEIDLIELFNKMGRGIKNGTLWLLKQIKLLIILLIRKSLWIIIFGIIGLFIAYFLFTNSKRYYASELTATSNSVNSTYIINSVNLLNDLFKEQNYKIASDYLALSLDEVKKIKSIKSFYGIDVNGDGVPDYVDYANKYVYNPKDSIIKRLKDYFYVDIEVYDENIFSKARDGIINYIQRNPYVVQNNNERVRKNATLIVSYDNEIKKLDSLQKIEYFKIPLDQKAASNQMVILNEKTKELYHDQILKLEKTRLYYQGQNELYGDPITIIQDFTPLSKAENPYMQYAKKWGIVFAILGFIISLLWQYRKKIIKLVIEKQY